MSLAELKAFRMYIEVCVCVRPVLDLNHRCFNSALYIAKPTTAKTVAPKLARSQNVELLRSACVTCGYMAIVVNLTKISLLGASAVLQVKA